MFRRAADEFTPHIDALRRYAWSLTRCRHRAEDLVQEALAKAIGAAGSLRPGAPVRPWLFRIVRNVHVSQFRSDRRAEQAADSLEAGEAVSSPPHQYDRLELQSALAALEALPEGQREAITLIALQDLSYSEAAEVLGIPIGTLMSRLARGREALRQRLEGRQPPRLHVVGGRHD